MWYNLNFDTEIWDLMIVEAKVKVKLPCPLNEGSRGRVDEAPSILKLGILSTNWHSDNLHLWEKIANPCSSLETNLDFSVFYAVT